MSPNVLAAFAIGWRKGRFWFCFVAPLKILFFQHQQQQKQLGSKMFDGKRGKGKTCLGVCA